MAGLRGANPPPAVDGLKAEPGKAEPDEGAGTPEEDAPPKAGEDEEAKGGMVLERKGLPVC